MNTVNVTDERFYELGSDRYNTHNIYLNPKYIKAHELLEVTGKI